MKPIAENGEVLGIALRSKHSRVKRVSLGADHVTFPGFCNEHEKDFFSFEKGKIGFTTQKEETLQVLRSTARELWVATGDLEWLRECKKAYLEMIRNATASDDERMSWTSRIVSPVLEIIDIVERKEHGLRALLAALEDALITANYSSIVLTKVFTGTPFVALSGSTVLSVAIKPVLETDKECWFEALITLCAIPEPDGTRVIIASLVKEVLQSYQFQFFNAQNAEELLWEWMSGTDFWLASPTWWAILPKVKKDALLQALKTP